MSKKPADKKTCFVVGPIGDDDSEDRIHADWLLEEIIEPIFAENFPDFHVSRADRMPQPGQITTQVITALLESELVIADLSTLNPNAFYEIGIRHTIQKPIIHMHLEGQRIPFDVAAVRSVKFARRRPSDLRAARSQLLSMVKEALDPEHEIDNPVTFSRGKVQFDTSATPTERLIENEIAEVKTRLDGIENYFSGYRGPRNTINVSNLNRLIAAAQKIAIVVRIGNVSLSSAKFLKVVEDWASSAFEKYGLQPSDGSGSEIIISLDDSGANRAKAEAFKKDYDSDQIQVSVGVPKYLK